MSRSYSSPAVKLAIPLLIVILPLIFVRDFLSFLRMKPRSLEEFGSHEWLYMLLESLLPVILVGLVYLFFVKMYRPSIKKGADKKSILTAITLSVIVFAALAIVTYLKYGPYTGQTFGFSFFIPGSPIMPVMAFLCFGVVEAFSERLKEWQLWPVLVFFYFIFLFLSRFSLHPIFLIADAPINLGFEIPFLFVPQVLFHWSFFLPSVTVLMGTIIYVRLGFYPAVLFVLLSGLLSQLGIFFGLMIYATSIEFWLVSVGIIVLMLKSLNQKRT